MKFNLLYNLVGRSTEAESIFRNETFWETVRVISGILRVIIRISYVDA